MHKKFKGIIPPLITPLHENGEYDGEASSKLINHVLNGGVHGLFLLGTTGEGPSLSPTTQRKVVKTVMKQVNGRVPVLVSISNPCYSESLSLAKHCADQGVSAVVSTVPYYFPLDTAETKNFFFKLADDLPLPLILYHMPDMTKVHYNPETIMSLSEHENIIGLKDSSEDMGYFHQLLKALGEVDFLLIKGPEHLLAESVLLGGHGGICGGANVLPELFVTLYQAAMEGDLPRIRQLHRKVIEFGEAIIQIGSYGSSVFRGVKCALSIMGLCGAHVAVPFQSLDSHVENKIRSFLERNGILSS